MSKELEYRSIGFSFNGQNAQRPEMGKGLPDHPYFDIMSRVGKEYDIPAYKIRDGKIEGEYLDLKDLVTNGNGEDMRRTDVNQITLYTYAQALFDTWFKKAGLDFQEKSEKRAVGTSLGMFNALTAGGVMDFQTGLKIIAERGTSMQRASELMDKQGKKGKMLVISNTNRENLEQVIAEVNQTLGRDGSMTGVQLANINSINQIAIAGDEDAVEMAAAISAEKFRTKTIDPKIANPYHFRGYMEPALESFGPALERLFPNDPHFNFPVFSNYTGEEFPKDREGFLRELREQVVSPTEFVRNLTNLKTELIMLFGAQNYAAKFAEATLGKEIGTDIFVISCGKDIEDFDYDKLKRKVKELYPVATIGKADEVVVVSTSSLTAINSSLDTLSGAAYYDALLAGKKGIREIKPEDVPAFQDVVNLIQANETRDAILQLKPEDITVDKLKEIQATLMKSDERAKALFAKFYKSGAAALIPNKLLDRSLQATATKDGIYPNGWEPEEKDPFMSYAFLVAQQALNDAGVLENGVLLESLQALTSSDFASGIGGIMNIEQGLIALIKTGVVRPLAGKFMIHILQNLATGHISNHFRLRGTPSSSNAACAASGVALLNLYNAISNPDNPIQAGLVGGSESAARSIFILAFDYLMGKKGALDRVWREMGIGAENALRPLSMDRGGFIPGDGAAAAFVMSRSLADQLDIPYKARILGICGSGCIPSEKGKSITNATLDGQARAMNGSLHMAGIPATEVKALFLHGTGTPDGDPNENASTRNVFNERGAKPIYTGVKGKIGHTLGAAFMHGFIGAIEASDRGMVQGIGTTEADKLADFAKTVQVALDNTPIQSGSIVGVNSFGFGGVNVSALVQAIK